jgi:hypothetical protein
MSATALLRRNVLPGAKRLTASEPLLPFLYNTRTIRHESTDALSELDDLLDERKSTPRSRDQDSGNRSSFRPRSDRHENEERPRRYEGTRPRREGIEDGSDGFSERPRTQYQRPVREEHIPFEHAAQETLSIRDKIVTSTMTPHEKRAFEGLLSLSQQKEPKDKSRYRDRVDEVLKRASKSRAQQEALDAAPMPEALKNMQKKMNEDRSAAQKVLLEQAVEQDIQQVKKAFATAETDVELWKMLHEKVLSRVAQLHLEDPAPPKQPKQPTRKQRAKAKIETDATQQSQWPGNIPDEQVITRTLPQHLVECERQLFFDFPSSQLHVSLLPYLKSLGPTTFALASSTKLYNQHMRSLFKSQSNLPQIVHTLEEMDKEVYEFDDKTRDLVETILKRGRLARKETFGLGMSALWGGERFRKGGRAAKYWAHKIEERMQEQALKEARAKEDVVEA